jgi:hypothetical protein
MSVEITIMFAESLSPLKSWQIPYRNSKSKPNLKLKINRSKSNQQIIKITNATN